VARNVIALIFVLLLPSTSAAQRVPLATEIEIEGVTYDKSVPAPEAVLGYVVGTRHT
jgi:hypothetical protein